MRSGSIGLLAGVCKMEEYLNIFVSIHLHAADQLLQLGFFQMIEP